MSFAPEDRLIVALDADEARARDLARALKGSVRWVKVGMTLFYQAGPGIVVDLRDAGFNVFLDLKLHDIPHQVRGAAEAVARLGVQMLTTHASGGEQMLRAAVDGAAAGASAAGVTTPAVLAVTVLTSMDDAALASVGVAHDPSAQVELLARLARASGTDGIVCSPREARIVRGLLGTDAFVVTPGVRPSGSTADDQARTATPSEALGSGASHLVVGRPITEAADPAAAARRLLDEMRESA